MSKVTIEMPGRAVALVTTDRAFAELGITEPSDADTSRMQDMILDVSDQIARYIDQPAGLGLCTVIETFSTDLGDFPTGDMNELLPQLRLFLSVRPVGTISSVTTSPNGDDLDADGLDVDDGIGLLTLAQGCVWPDRRGNRSVTVEYQGGYVLPTAQPADGQSADDLAASGPALPRSFQRATLQAVKEAWLTTGDSARSPDLAMEIVEGIGRSQYAPASPTGSGLPQSVEGMLDQFRSMGF